MTDHWELLDVYKALLATAAGMILGLERELKDKAAGLKTITIICLGSTLFALISYKVGLADNETTRIASYVVSGIGFIGAGVIYKDGVTVSGLTTAGIIWLASAVGIAIGFGEFFVAATFMAASLFIVYSSPWINKLLYTRKEKRNLVISLYKNDFSAREEIFSQIKSQKIRIEERKIELKDDIITVSVEAVVMTRRLKWLEDYLITHPKIINFSF